MNVLRAPAAGAAIAMCLTLAGCTSTVDGSVVANVPPADLPGLLLSVEQVRAVMAAPQLAVRTTFTQLDTLPPGSTMEPRECLGAMFSGEAQTYEGSGHQAFYGLSLTDSGSARHGPMVEQGVVAFGDGVAAQAMVAKSAEQWRACAGKRFTGTYKGAPVGAWTLGQPTKSANMITLPRVDEDEQGWGCVHTMAAKSNIVVDAEVCGNDLADQPEDIIRGILANIPG